MPSNPSRPHYCRSCAFYCPTPKARRTRPEPYGECRFPMPNLPEWIILDWQTETQPRQVEPTGGAWCAVFIKERKHVKRTK
jgi:hypothetical protein